MKTELQADIEKFLFYRGTWVHAKELVERFELADKRVLRARGKKPGPLAAFAFSCSQYGYIHQFHLCTADFLRLGNRNARHSIAELRQWKHQRIARRQCLERYGDRNVEIHTEQVRLAL